jgi:glutathione S-transferase
MMSPATNGTPELPLLSALEPTLADAYLLVVLNWARSVNIDLSPYPHVLAHRKRVGARPAARAAMQAEGLI